MTNPVRGQLLDHLLGALDEPEQEAVARQLQDDPQLRRDYVSLQSRIEVVQSVRVQFPPPSGLARRTCDFVAARRSRPSADPNGRTPMTAVTAPPDRVGRLRWLDVAVAAGILVAASLLILPALQNLRFDARRLACQDNLRELGRAMTEYSDAHGGYFPGIPRRGNMAVAGAFAPTLVDGGFVRDARRFFCPGASSGPGDSSGDSTDHVIPTIEQLQKAVGDELKLFRGRMSGDMASDMGWADHNNVYQRPKNLRRSTFAIISDAPDPLGRQGGHHGNSGENVLFEDTHVEFVVDQVGPHGDEIFLNDYGRVGLGVQPNDAVLAPAGTLPILPVDSR